MRIMTQIWVGYFVRKNNESGLKKHSWCLNFRDSTSATLHELIPFDMRIYASLPLRKLLKLQDKLEIWCENEIEPLKLLTDSILASPVSYEWMWFFFQVAENESSFIFISLSGLLDWTNCRATERTSNQVWIVGCDWAHSYKILLQWRSYLF